VRLLVVRVSSIGDIVHTLPAVNLIRAGCPEAEISWLVREGNAALLRQNPIVDNVVIIPDDLRFASIRGLSWFEQAIRKPKFDVVVNFQPTVSSSVGAFLSGAPRRFGFEFSPQANRSGANLFGSPIFMSDPIRRPYMSPLVHVIDHNLQLASLVVAELGGSRMADAPVETVFPLPYTSEFERERINNLFPDISSCPMGAAVLLPGTLWASKSWSEQSWSSLAQLLADSGFFIILAGGTREQQICKEIERVMTAGSRHSVAPVCLNLCGRTTLTELILLFEKAKIVVGGDTGPLHLAAAVDKPWVIGIYGSTPVGRNGPYGARSRTINLSLDCQPCFEPVCKYGTNACLVDLRPGQVLDQIKALCR
jgi:lipopolysaccharide heptosyltransferase II